MNPASTLINLDFRTWDQAKTIWPEFRIFSSMPISARSVVDDALMYAEMGLHVLPGVPGLKVPYYGSKWIDASCEPDEVCRLFERHPDAEILAICGPSKLGVVDDDYYKRDDRVPFDMTGYPTWTFVTPKGGIQHVFSDPDGVAPTTADKVAPAVDTRGVGGLIVVPSVNSPKRQWTARPGERPAPWPVERFAGLGTAMTRGSGHTDDIATWVTADGDRMPNEDCPGEYHILSGRQPRLGVQRMPNGTYKVECWSGCLNDEVHPLLIEAGRYTAEELSGYVEPVKNRWDTFDIGRDDLMALEPPRWIIEPYIQEGALIQLTAKFNTGKTFVAVNWGCEMAEQGKRVLYVALEGLTGLQKRIKAWEIYNDKISQLRYMPRGFGLNLLSDRSVDEFCEGIVATDGRDLIIIDNLGECVPGDENDSETISRAMASLNKIRMASGGAVMDLHNSGHSGATRSRGHSKMLDVHDTVIYLESIEGSLKGFKIRCGKERNAERFTERKAQLKPVEGSGSLVAVMGSAAMAQANPYYNAVKLGHTTTAAVEKFLNVSNSTADENLKKLVLAGDLSVLKMGKQNVYSALWDLPSK